MLKFLKKNCFLFFLIFFATFQLSQSLGKPFIGHHDWNGAFWGSITRDYLVYLDSDKFLRYFPNNLVFNHYTPLLPVLFTISSKILGLNEFSLRLVSMLFSVAMVIFVYRIGKFLYQESVGLIAAVFLMVTPMFVYFGKLPDHEPIVTSLITITFYFYIKSGGGKSKNNFLLFLIFLFLALFESWPAYFLLIPLTFVTFFVRKEKIGRALWPLTLGIAVLAIHLLLVFIGQGWVGIGEFFSSGIGRSTTAELYFGGTKYTPVTFVIAEARYATIYFTRILLVMSGLYFLGFLFRYFAKKIEKGDTYLIALFVYPICFILTFRELAFIHDYKLYHFLPFISLSSGVLLVHLIGVIKNYLGKIGFGKLAVKTSLVLITIIIVSAVYFERLPYLATLQATSFNYPGYELGNLIKQNTHVSDKVYVDSLDFNQFFGVFVDFYAQRKVEYGDLTLGDFKETPGFFEKYKYFVVVRDKGYDKELFEFMSLKYYKTELGNFVFFSESDSK